MKESESAKARIIDMKKVYENMFEIVEKKHNDSIIELTNNINKISLNALLNSLERYDPYSRYNSVEMDKSEDGEWVRFEDVKKLLNK